MIRSSRSSISSRLSRLPAADNYTDRDTDTIIANTNTNNNGLLLLTVGVGIGTLPFLVLNSSFYIQFYAFLFRQLLSVAVNILSELRHFAVGTVLSTFSCSTLFLLLNLLILLIFAITHFNNKSGHNRNRSRNSTKQRLHSRRSHFDSDYDTDDARPRRSKNDRSGYGVPHRRQDIGNVTAVARPAPPQHTEPMTLIFSPPASPSGSLILSPMLSRSLSPPSGACSASFYLNTVISVTEYSADGGSMATSGAVHQEFGCISDSGAMMTSGAVHREFSAISEKGATILQHNHDSTPNRAAEIDALQMKRENTPKRVVFREGAAMTNLSAMLQNCDSLDTEQNEEMYRTPVKSIIPPISRASEAMAESEEGSTTTPMICQRRINEDLTEDANSSVSRPLPSARFKGHLHHHLMASSVEHQAMAMSSPRKRGSAKKGDTLDAVWRAICEEKNKVQSSSDAIAKAPPASGPALTQFSSTSMSSSYINNIERRNSSGHNLISALAVQSPIITKARRSGSYGSPLRHCRTSTVTDTENNRDAESRPPMSPSSSTSTTAMSPAVLMEGSGGDKDRRRHVRHRSPSSSVAQQLRMSMRKEPSMRLDELHARIESFIARFNHQIRLQREQSMINYLDMQGNRDA